jgi:hypothetical protein
MVLGLENLIIKLTFSLGFLRKFKHLVSFMRELIIVGRVLDELFGYFKSIITYRSEFFDFLSIIDQTSI